MQIRDLTNQRFGKLLVLYKTDKRKKNSVIWVVKCHCENVIEITSRSVTCDQKKDCGCTSKSEKMKKYSINEKYFEKPNTENSYWAGFIAADGYINDYKCKYRRASIMLSKRDINHLEKLKEQSKYTGPVLIRYRPNKKSKNKYFCLLQISSSNWIKDLETNFQIVPKKTHILNPPKLEYPNNLAFIAGFIDGDGCISFSKKKKWKYITITIVCASIKMIT